MIWGRIITWRPWFAWHPVSTLSRRSAWLCRVERRWNRDLDLSTSDVYGGTPTGAWEYRLPIATNLATTERYLHGYAGDVARAADMVAAKITEAWAAPAPASQE